MKWIAAAFAGVGLLALTLWAFGPATGSRPVEAGERVGPRDVYNPVTAGEPLPDGFRQLVPRDGIRPIYDPQFTSRSGVSWPEDTQVIGVASDDEAKAYPVSFLNRHEMVVDFIAGDPILVTW
ncbi:MAG: DUF3179 domain-containing protein [Acidimicrobiia bacterium]|nr:DUF3179 domain-containing protein [Acidimicrobiia bacterium]NNC91789.1 DUF3179 domain-containing protein [Acidimicrobiia bacterium]